MLEDYENLSDAEERGADGRGHGKRKRRRLTEDRRFGGLPSWFGWGLDWSVGVCVCPHNENRNLKGSCNNIYITSVFVFSIPYFGIATAH